MSGAKNEIKFVGVNRALKGWERERERKEIRAGRTGVGWGKRSCVCVYVWREGVRE